MLDLLGPVLMRRTMCVWIGVYRTEAGVGEVLLDWRGVLLLGD